MRTALLLPASCLIAVVYSAIAHSEVRSWTDRTGQQIEAELYMSREDTVYLLHQGEALIIRLAELSKADQRYVRDMRAGTKGAFDAAANAEGTTDDTAQTRAATPSLPQNPPAQRSGEAPAPTGTAHAELRTWTARNGKYTVVAAFVTGDELSVTLGRDGKQRTVPLAALCQADQQFVRDTLAAASPTLAQEHAPAKSADEASLAAATSVGKQTVASEPLAVFGIRTSMKLPEIVQIMRSRGLRVDPRYQSRSSQTHSELSNLPQYKNVADKYRFVNRVDAVRKDGLISTSVYAYLLEDLPGRPGVGICSDVVALIIYEGDGEPDLGPWFEKARQELISRYGQPVEERANFIAYGDKESEQLTVELHTDRLQLRLVSKNIAHRSENGKKILHEQHKLEAPELTENF